MFGELVLLGVFPLGVCSGVGGPSAELLSSLVSLLSRFVAEVSAESSWSGVQGFTPLYSFVCK